ncbi:unnamed protein product, partial [marine sediment metagenome]
LMSEVNYLETGDATLVAIKDRLVNIRSTLTNVLSTANNILLRLPSLIGGRFPVTDCLTELVKTQRIKVTNTPTPLPLHPLSGRRLLIIFNNSNATLYYGESDVSGGQGMPLLAGQPVSINIRETCKIYAVVSSADVAKNIRILEGK